MDEIPESREISGPTLEAMVHETTPEWELRESTAVERGFCSVYRLVVERDGVERARYLKCSPDGQAWAIPTESRLQAVLAAQTSIPVPEVLGVVDDHETHPTPYYLMSAVRGDATSYEHIVRFDDDALQRFAREMGAYLAELHGVPVVESFGHVRHVGPELTGGHPGDDPATLTVGTPRESWPTYLRERVDSELERHADSRFSELTPELRRWFDAGIDRLEGPFDPILGRNDHGLHNLLVDAKTGEVTAILDWGYTLAVPAAFDFEFAVYLYGGAFLAGLSDVTDRRPLVRNAMLAGYRSTAPDRAETVATPEPLYEALALVRIMNDFHHLDLPEERELAVIERIRDDVRALVE
ncbi:aminoglycoside phosphotransferase [Haloprofundus marisrubri]|uniref:Aminoglycoside phosphotransferase n=1 Tax=Haloprofundus marisrubri TaxID=1514971 RepID=A0A0W1RBW0_9EURY|nr:phosphotransferase [Haloprofundus marisrubri]KTG10946.1 aminoglycoside phosphotransferase [Haloprofundus marisrubri]